VALRSHTLEAEGVVDSLLLAQAEPEAVEQVQQQLPERQERLILVRVAVVLIRLRVLAASAETAVAES
jgi:hypothetical protein